MATNAKPGADDTENLSDEEELRRAKADLSDVETPPGEDEPADPADAEDEPEDEGADDQKPEDADEPTDDEEPDGSEEEDDSVFVKEFDNIKGDTIEEYARSLEAAYRNSSAEAIKLKRENDQLKQGGPSKDNPPGDDGKPSDETPADSKSTDPLYSYMQQKVEEEAQEAFGDFSKTYSQVNDPNEYQKFVDEVAILAETIQRSQKRWAPPRELYSKAAASLGWQPIETKPNGKEKLGIALKGRASITKTGTGPKKPASKSKVTQAMIEANKKMYPGKSDEEIRKELEPYVQ